MNFEEIQDLIRQVRFNCELASLRQAGTFSVCGLAMRLRDLQKWERGLLPWEEEDPNVVLSWISKKEEYWESIEHLNFQQIMIKQLCVDPMDMGSLNNILREEGLFYGAGLSEGICPSFFLAGLESETELLGVKVSILSKEYARDLMGTPALSKGDQIMIRKEALSFYLWNSVIFARNENKKAFLESFRSFGLTEWNYGKIKELITDIIDQNLMMFVYHELGEIKEDSIDLNAYHKIIRDYQRTLVEFLLRALRDLLADTHEQGRFNWIVETQNDSALALSIALLDDYRLRIYGDIKTAYDEFLSNRSWRTFSKAVTRNRKKGKELFWKTISIIEKASQCGCDVNRKIREEIIPLIGMGT